MDKVDSGYCLSLAEIFNQASEDLAQVTLQDPAYDGPSQGFSLVLNNIIEYLRTRANDLPAGPQVTPLDKDVITTQVSVPVFICTEKCGRIEDAIGSAKSTLEDHIDQARQVWDHVKVSTPAMQFNHIGVQVQAIVTAVMDCWDDIQEG